MKLDNIIEQYLGNKFQSHITRKFVEISNKVVCVIDVMDASRPVYVKRDGATEFYIRASASTRRLSISEAMDYIKEKWPDFRK